MARMVKCAKLGRELPGLDRPPVPGALGKRIFENISAQAWDLWKAQSVLLINHYGLNLLEPEAQKFLREQMEKFLFEDVVQVPEGWEPEGATQAKGDAPAPAKGAPAPAKK
jgi:Fe-S cluster biosynthesis and repair protein YggX